MRILCGLAHLYSNLGTVSFPTAVVVVPWVTPVLRASGAHVPHSWQVLLPVLPPCAAGCCSAHSPHFMQVCSDSFQTREY